MFIFKIVFIENIYLQYLNIDIIQNSYNIYITVHAFNLYILKSVLSVL